MTTGKLETTPPVWIRDHISCLLIRYKGGGGGGGGGIIGCYSKTSHTATFTPGIIQIVIINHCKKAMGNGSIIIIDPFPIIFLIDSNQYNNKLLLKIYQLKSIGLNQSN